MDLVILERSAAESGGVYVLFSRLANQITAVEEETVATTPSQSHLGAAYPNPFNPGVVIPFTLGASGGTVTLTIYNTLGQAVRKMKLGEMPAGTHQAEWDGLDDVDQALSSGVYLYRLQAGTWNASDKMVKSE